MYKCEDISLTGGHGLCHPAVHGGLWEDLSQPETNFRRPESRLRPNHVSPYTYVGRRKIKHKIRSINDTWNIMQEVYMCV